MNRFFFSLLAVSLITGCTLRVAPDCEPGTKRCAPNESFGNYMSYLCGDDFGWVPVSSCTTCDGNVCSDDKSEDKCENNGETTCTQTPSMGIQFTCMHGSRVMQPCGVNVKCDGNLCGAMQSGGDDDSEKQCLWLGEQNLAIQVACVDHQWQAWYCSEGLGCNGDVCNTADTVVTCETAGEIRNNANNTCVCDADNHWTGEAGSCKCADGYLPINHACEEAVNCTDAGKLRDDTTNTCVCDTDNHWIEKADHCECADDYLPIDNACVVPIDCPDPSEIREDITNTCICDAANHWTGNAGSCKCEDGYLPINHACEEAVICSGAGEIRDDTTNTCICDADNHWTGDAGSCDCDEESYLTADGRCIQCKADEFWNINKLKCEKAVKCTDENVSTESTCIFGKYYQVKGSNRKYDIEWKIISIDDDGNFLMLSQYVLDALPYHYGYRDITWSQCTLRSWLNSFGSDQNVAGQNYTVNGFKTIAFNQNEIQRILTVENDNPDNANYNTPGGEKTTDSIFCLSMAQASEHSNSGILKGTPTNYANGRNDLSALPPGCSGDECGCIWWLRSPGKNSERVAGVNPYGIIDDASYTLDNWGIGVRPALWLKRSE